MAVRALHAGNVGARDDSSGIISTPPNQVSKQGMTVVVSSSRIHRPFQLQMMMIITVGSRIMPCLERSWRLNALKNPAAFRSTTEVGVPSSSWQASSRRWAVSAITHALRFSPSLVTCWMLHLVINAPETRCIKLKPIIIAHHCNAQLHFTTIGHGKQNDQVRPLVAHIEYLYPSQCDS